MERFERLERFERMERFERLERSERVSRRGFLTASAFAIGALLPGRARAQGARITTTDLGGAWLVQGAGCNVVAIAGPDGALMIDGGRAANAAALLEAVMKATDASRIHTLVNTHWHPDQVGANEAVGKAGGVIIAHEIVIRLTALQEVSERANG